MKSRLLRAKSTSFLTVTVFALTTVLFLRGQAVENAQISGVIADSSGSLVSDAAVTVTDTSTNVSRTTVSGTNGTYVLPNLPIGTYQLRVTAKGFKAYTQIGIVLSVGSSITVPIVLSVGTVTQQVTVTANAAMVQTQDASTSQVVGEKEILELPLNGREITSLVTLSGAAANASTVGDFVAKTYGSTNIVGSSAIAVGGGQANGVNYVLDGGDNNDAYSNVNLPLPFPDAIAEFNVQINGLSARYGLHTGGTVNVVTKSGTNAFHGGVFEFARNGSLNARNYFSIAEDTLVRNQFGGTVGGPILHSRLFFFSGYQGTRITSTPASSISYVPTQQVLSGDFSQIESSSCQTSGKGVVLTDPTTGSPFLGNQIPTKRFNSQALAILKYLPVSTDPCGKYQYGVSDIENEDQYIGRLDWARNDKHTVFGRYFAAHLVNPPAPLQNDLLYTNRAGFKDLSQSLTLGDTYAFSPMLLNSLHLTGTKSRIDRYTQANDINPNTVGIDVSIVVPNFIYMSIPGYFSLGCGSCAPAYFGSNAIQIADDIDRIVGRHHFSFGANWIYDQLSYQNSYQGNGNWTFNGQSTGSALVDFMLGLPSTFIQANAVVAYPRQQYVGVYAEDAITLNRNLSMQLGLRWEPFLPAADKQSEIDHFSASNFAAGIVSKVFTNAPPGELFVGDAGIPKSYARHKYTDFEPRISAAWDPRGDGKQSIRSSYSVFYDYPELNYATHPGQGAPWGSTVTLSSPSNGLSAPWGGYPGGNPFPTPIPPPANVPFVDYGSYYDIPLNIQPTYVQDWSLSYQRQLATNWLMSASYLGSKTTHMWIGTEQNPAVYIPGTCGGKPCSTTSNTNQRRVLYLQNATAGAYYSTIANTDDGANVAYNALLISARHRTAQHYTILANYTYSHCISEGNFTGELSGPTYQNPYDRDADRGNCAFDHRHIVNISVVASVPRVSSGWSEKLLSDWQIAPLISAQSGGWFSPATGTDNSLTGVGLDRPNVIGNRYLRNAALQWLNPAGFSPNATGAFGDSGAFSLVGPQYVDIDVAFSRLFAIRNEQTLEARFEAFNCLNHPNFENPTATETSSTFGRILAANSPRILQFAMKYNF